MPVVKYAPVRFPACDLKICYQLNLLLGFFVSCFLILSPALYFYLLQEPLTVIELLPGRTSTASDDGITSQVELSVIPSPPGLAGGSHSRPTGNRSGIFPVMKIINMTSHCTKRIIETMQVGTEFILISKMPFTAYRSIVSCIFDQLCN